MKMFGWTPEQIDNMSFSNFKNVIRILNMQPKPKKVKR